MEPEELRIDHDCEMTWVQIKVTGASSLYVGAFYRPPDSDNPDYLAQLDTCLSRIPENAHIWLSGDFNLADIDWTDNSLKGSATKTALCNQLINITADRFLQQLVSQPTRITETTESLLDLFFCNNRSLVNTVEVIPGISDHEAVYIEASLRPHKTPQPPRTVFCYNKADYDSIKKGLHILHQDMSDMLTASVDKLWTMFTKHLSDLMHAHIPAKTLKGRKMKKPWIDRKVRTAIRKKARLYTRMRKTKKQQDIRKYRQCKGDVQKLERQAYFSYINNIIEVNEDHDDKPSKQKRFWSYIKSLRKDNTGISPLKDKGRLFNAPKDKANILNRQYQSTFTQEDTNQVPSPSGIPYPDMEDIEVDEAGIRKLLQKTNPRKATGPDSIPARILKDCASELAPILTIIFNKSLQEGKVPEDWRHANVTAIYKKGTRHDAANYRPVSLTSLYCKLLEHVIVSKTVNHLERYNILDDCQHGFRAKRSCETQILTLYHELAASLDKKIQTDMIILDFSKAFDRVPHQRLLKKVYHYGIRGTTYQWISSFLNSRTQQVLVEGQSSEKVPVVSGVPQGSVLGPVLFLIFINDLPEDINSRTRLFADDCILYRQISSENDQQLLQEDLDRLATWEKTWGMEFHPQKCSDMRISRAKTPRTFQYHLKGVPLAEEQSSKYLGVDLQSNLSWKNHISRITKKSNNMLGFLRRNLRQASEETKAQAYFTMVRSNLDYCSTIWSPYQRDQKHQVEMVQRRSARFVTNRYRNTSSVSDMLDYLGWESHETRRSKLQLIVLYKIVHRLIDIPHTDYLTQTNSRTRSAHK